MHSNNETGVLQPVAELAGLARSAGALVHTDAAQSLGKVPVRVRELDVDLLSIAGHKLYAPKGVGALYVKRGTPLVPFALGAGHERGLRPGTENVASIVGLGAHAKRSGGTSEAAASNARATRPLWARNWRAAFRALCSTATASCACRTRSTCASLAPQAAPSSMAHRDRGVDGIGLPRGTRERVGGHPGDGRAPEEALGSVRLTLGRGTTEDDVVRAAAALVGLWRRLTRE
jgi:cysteine desulfurase